MIKISKKSCLLIAGILLPALILPLASCGSNQKDKQQEPSQSYVNTIQGMDKLKEVTSKAQSNF